MPPLRHRLASLAALYVGCVLLAGAGASLLAAHVLPADGMRDLGRIAFAMILAALAVVPFLVAALLTRREGPRWLRVASLVGAAVGAVPAVAVLAARF